jgi:hypothetical protein
VNVPLYHRLTQNNVEEANVRASGQLWGKSARELFGNADAAVRAYIGPLPQGTQGYTFTTEAKPTRDRAFFGKPGVEWIDGSADVHAVPGRTGFVFIWVKAM